MRVLLVEDQGLTALDITTTLESHGHHVVAHVVDFASAMALVSTETLDAILMDIRIEGPVDGIEAAVRIKKSVDLPIVFLTGSSDPETLARIKVSGADGYLLKPYDEAELIGTLEVAAERHGTARAARLAALELGATLRAIGDAVIATDASGRIRMLNPAAERATGWRESEALGRAFGEVVVLEERSGTRVDPLGQALARRETVTLGEPMMLRQRGGRRLDVTDSASPILGPEGELLGGVMILQDVTDRMRLRQVLERNDRVQSLGMLASSVAHELNNPLAAATASLGHIQRQDLDPAQRAALDDVRLALESMRSTLGDMGVLSSDARSPQERVDLRTAVERAVRMVGKAIETRAQLRVELPSTPLPVHGDTVRVAQLVVNVLMNAGQAFAEFDADNHVNVLVRARGDEGQVIIQDNGRGIEAEHLDRVFDPFFSTRPVGEGSGLGLPVGLQIVSSLGGSLTLTSTAGSGTTARISLPLERVVDHVEPSRKPTGTIQGLNILVIDDDVLVRRGLQRLLSRHNTVVVADGLDQAVAHIESDLVIHLVLCDVMMAPLPGPQVYKCVADGWPELASRWVFMTGGVYDGQATADIAALDRPLLAKPFSMEQLADLVDGGSF